MHFLVDFDIDHLFKIHLLVDPALAPPFGGSREKTRKNSQKTRKKLAKNSRTGISIACPSIFKVFQIFSKFFKVFQSFLNFEKELWKFLENCGNS